MSGYLGNPVSGLMTDLYELTMAAGYIQKKMDVHASFELFIRHLPARRNYLVAAGLEQALDFLETSRFSSEDISYLRSLPQFRKVDASFFEFLVQFRFSGDVWALPEGTIFFPGEPLLRLTAPIAEAQLVETSLLSILHLQTLVASKAARVTAAAGTRSVVEFGSRRAHGIEAGVLAARAAFIAGCDGTSNTYAGKTFGIRVYGTQAHSWIMAHRDEAAAFSSFLDVFPERSTLLIDTYDVRPALEKILALGRKPYAVRLDSGDVLADSQWVRQRLDEFGWNEVKIFVSGDLDEDRIETLLRDGASVDAFGVGTALSTSADAPSLSVIYKLVEVETEGRVRSTAKFSEEKNTYPGRKQVFRFSDRAGFFSSDVIGLEAEAIPAEPLLVPVMEKGQRRSEMKQDSIAAAKAARERFLASRRRLPSHLQSLQEVSQPFPVCNSTALETLSDQVRHQLMQSSPAGPVERRTISPTFFLWAVDVQNDFMLPGGKLYVPDAEKIIPNVKRLVDACRQGLGFLLSSLCAHDVDDPEFAEWPPHCVKGTWGAELIKEIRGLHRYVIPYQREFAIPKGIQRYQQVVFEKHTLDIFDNPNVDRVLAQLEPRSAESASETEFLVFGVVTEYCVRITVEGLLGRGLRVALVTDAVQSLDQVRGVEVLKNLASRGCRLCTTNEALAVLTADRLKLNMQLFSHER